MPRRDTYQLDLFPDQLLLRRIDPAKRMKRFYLMTVQRDLFAQVSLVREWGRIGSPGTVAVDHFADEGLAVDALATFAKAKRKRGYDI